MRGGSWPFFDSFLYTGEYRILENYQIKAGEDIIMAKLRIAVRVFLEGHVWYLPLLTDEARREILSLSKSIHIFDTVRLIDEMLEECTFQNLSQQKEWLKFFLMNSLEVAFKDDNAEFENLSLFNKLKNTVLIKFLAENLFKICYSRIPKSNSWSLEVLEKESSKLDSDSELTLTPKITSSNEDSENKAVDEFLSLSRGLYTPLQ